jgi:hypothetical protein
LDNKNYGYPTASDLLTGLGILWTFCSSSRYPGRTAGHLGYSNKIICKLANSSDILSSGLAASIGRFAIGLTTNSLPDLTWVAPELIIWIQVEPGCYLISACLLTLRPLLDKIMNSNFVQGWRRNIYRVFGRNLPGTNGSMNAGSNIGMKLQPFATASKGSAAEKGLNQLGEEGRVGSNLKSVMGTIVAGVEEVDVEKGKDRGHRSGGPKILRDFQP